MKKISILLLLVALSATTVFGQDSATQQQIDQLRGKIQDLTEAQDAQKKAIDELAKKINELSDKVNTPPVSTGASTDDLKALAEKVQEIDKKRQADRELILKQLEKLGNTTGGSSTHVRTPPNITSSTSTTGGGDTATTPAGPQKGYYYTVEQGDMLSAIAKAYRDKGVKVTTTQILKANPGLDANKLIAGKKIFIPDPNAP